MKRGLIVIFVFWFFSSYSQVRLLSFFKNDTVRFAALTKMEIVVQVPKQSHVFLPHFQNHLPANLQLHAVKIDTNYTKSQAVYKITLELLPFDDTLFVVLPIPIQVDTAVYYTDTLRLRVLPIEKDTAQIKKIDTTQAVPVFDVKPVLKAPFTWKEFWLRYGRYILLGLLILLLLAGLYYLYRKYLREKLKKKPHGVPKITVPAHIYALERLQELKQKQLYQKGLYAEFYSELSEILRQYLELRFLIGALELTTSELESLLMYQELIDHDNKLKLFTVLRDADLVKFAKYVPSVAICRRDLDYAFDFVRSTKPSEPEQQDQEKSQETDKTEKSQQ